MDFAGYGGFHLLPLIVALLLSSGTPALVSAVAGGGQINSNSVLVALLDSHYTELAELVEKALLLPTLEEAVGRHNLTVFAPRNEALERKLDPEFKRFLLEPGNLKSLQTLILFHFVPSCIYTSSFPSARHRTLAGDHVELSRSRSGENCVDSAVVVHPDAVVRPDGVIHGIESLLVPRSVQEDFNRRRNLADISAVLPTGAPEVDPEPTASKAAPPSPAGSLPPFPSTTPSHPVPTSPLLQHQVPDPASTGSTVIDRSRISSKPLYSTVATTNSPTFS
ncbi:hypothetical protein HPP92_018066 [Vanilla planifolia]|uniref:FAS1 domain-containing protein n=1 Tax=Vanilla planifolia TaxID=51239 RepID=A0A835QHB4_VANPL|nr:hypothetical protein HPP92_018066 [Vanilla planifolia]